MRLTFDCVMAARAPMVSERTATVDTIPTQSILTGQKTVRNRRSSSAKLAALDATLTYALMLVGAPSYTSGAHWWNGTAAILKKTPAATVESARNVKRSPRGPFTLRSATRAAITWIFGEPAIPYRIEKP